MAIVRAQDGPSSSTTCPFSYDVFLSFRGEDTRKNFTDHLYAALLQAGIRTFRDDDELERGKNLKPELEKAIKQSAVSIIVFSESYASSTWCLDELLAILESKNKSSNHQIIPVFYKVEPSDVRKQEGSFAEAFGRYDSQLQAETNQEKKKTWREKLKAWIEELKAWREAFGWYDSQIEAETNQEKNKEWMKKVKAWREALTEAANLTGMVLADRHETKFIKEIVEAVEEKLNLKALYVLPHLVGRSYIIIRIASSLRDGSANAAAIHVIYGIGGIGKTTIAKCIYNLHYRNFEASCFLSDVRERSKKLKGLVNLQSQLVSEIQKKEKETIRDSADGILKVQRAIRNKSVLIVLDDVTDQLKVLLGDDVTEADQLKALLGPRSKIIIATRDMGLLRALRVPCKVHPIEILDHHESLELFSWHAFRQDHPKEAYIKLSEVIVDYCGGIPLALTVLGSSLIDRSIAYWEATIRKLEAIPNPEIQKVLQISYESLQDDNDKDLFLHIACFFTGEDKDYIVTILEDCDLHPVVGIEHLIDRCLLVIEDNKLMMHQLIQEMGREIVRRESLKEPGERSRLWDHEDSFHVLRENTGTTKIEGLVLDMDMIERAPQGSPLNIDTFEKMKNLKILKLNNVRRLTGSYETGSYEKFPERLRFVCWHRFPSESIPIGIPLENLVALDMSYSKLKQVWKGYKVLNSLKILNLSYSLALIKTPRFTGLPILKSLILKGCARLGKVCESITNLEKLVFLDIEDCTRLQNIPSLPRSLVTLKMSNCQNLGGVGQVKWLACLPCLETLSIEGCNLSNNSFPMYFNTFSSLKCLNISNNSITTLPNCFINLSTLEELYVNCCSRLKSIQGLPTALRLLETNDNKSLKEVKGVPNTINRFNFYQSYNLNAVEDCFKLIPIDKVDRKIIKNLGIESLPLTSIQLVPIKVLYEFGIFSTFVRGRELPSCFMYKKMGLKISFTVPDNRRIHGLNVCCIVNREFWWRKVEVEVSNKTKGFKWIYQASNSVNLFEEHVWLSLWKCGNLLEGEDEVDVEIICDGVLEDEVQCCCINLLYEDEIWEEDRKGEAEIDLSWNDKMRVELSNYNECGKTYCFSPNCLDEDTEHIQYVDWWGLKTLFSETDTLIDLDTQERLINKGVLYSMYGILKEPFDP